MYAFGLHFSLFLSLSLSSYLSYICVECVFALKTVSQYLKHLQTAKTNLSYLRSLSTCSLHCNKKIVSPASTLFYKDRSFFFITQIIPFTLPLPPSLVNSFTHLVFVCSSPVTCHSSSSPSFSSTPIICITFERKQVLSSWEEGRITVSKLSQQPHTAFYPPPPHPHHHHHPHLGGQGGGGFEGRNHQPSVGIPSGGLGHHPHHHPFHLDPSTFNMLPFEAPTIFEQLPRFFFKMPRVHQDQKGKFESDELFRRISRESEVLITLLSLPSLSMKKRTQRGRSSEILILRKKERKREREIFILELFC